MDVRKGIARTEHRVVVMAGGVKGWPVHCACGWSDYAWSQKAAYALMREHKRKNAAKA